MRHHRLNLAWNDRLSEVRDDPMQRVGAGLAHELTEPVVDAFPSRSRDLGLIVKLRCIDALKPDNNTADVAAFGQFDHRLAAVLSDQFRVIERFSGAALNAVIYKYKWIVRRKLDVRRIRVRSTSRPELTDAKGAADNQASHVASFRVQPA